MKKTFNVKGMHCKSCEMLINDAVSEIDGVKKVESSSTKNVVIVEYDDKKVKENKIIETIKGEGYAVRI